MQGWGLHEASNLVKGSQGRLPEGGGISAKPQRVSIS